MCFSVRLFDFLFHRNVRSKIRGVIIIKYINFKRMEMDIIIYLRIYFNIYLVVYLRVLRNFFLKKKMIKKNFCCYFLVNKIFRFYLKVFLFFDSIILSIKGFLYEFFRYIIKLY